jgi:hypothetical protein
MITFPFPLSVPRFSCNRLNKPQQAKAQTLFNQKEVVIRK